jgi:SAM-dependent methyltransferase
MSYAASKRSGYMPQSLPTRLARAARIRGARPVLGDFVRWAGRLVGGLPWVVRGSRGEFAFQGESYSYLFHPYKRTWLTERAVEVPIVRRIVERHRLGRVIEVGNVLSHYGPQDHLVADKYEHAPGVLNRDVLELDDLGPFDLVVAISTLEHVGWDEEPQEPGKALEALRGLEALLAPGGRLVITVPVGYNPAFEAALRDGTLRLSHVGALRRVGGGTRWREVPVDEVWDAPYDFLLYSARGVVVAVIERPAA